MTGRLGLVHRTARKKKELSHLPFTLIHSVFLWILPGDPTFPSLPNAEREDRCLEIQTIAEKVLGGPNSHLLRRLDWRISED